jgi:hypothetical protein
MSWSLEAVKSIKAVPLNWDRTVFNMKVCLAKVMRMVALYPGFRWLEKHLNTFVMRFGKVTPAYD